MISPEDRRHITTDPVYLDRLIVYYGLDPIIQMYQHALARLHEGLVTGRPDGPVGWREHWQQQVDDANEILAYLKGKER